MQYLSSWLVHTKERSCALVKGYPIRKLPHLQSHLSKSCQTRSMASSYYRNRKTFSQQMEDAGVEDRYLVLVVF
jgi:hypothetical protein